MHVKSEKYHIFQTSRLKDLLVFSLYLKKLTRMEKYRIICFSRRNKTYEFFGKNTKNHRVYRR